MLTLIDVLSLYVRTVLLASNINADFNAASHALLLLIELAHLIVATSRVTVSPACLLALVIDSWTPLLMHSASIG